MVADVQWISHQHNHNSTNQLTAEMTLFILGFHIICSGQSISFLVLMICSTTIISLCFMFTFVKCFVWGYLICCGSTLFPRFKYSCIPASCNRIFRSVSLLICIWLWLIVCACLSLCFTSLLARYAHFLFASLSLSQSLSLQLLTQSSNIWTISSNGPNEPLIHETTTIWLSHLEWTYVSSHALIWRLISKL